MARYEKVFSLEPMLYTQGSPVIIEAGALQKDNTTSSVLAQLKFKNICDKIITALIVNVDCYDVSNENLGSVVFQYLDLNVDRNESFGSKSAIIVDNSTRKINVNVVKVIFEDDSCYEFECTKWDSIPAQQELKNIYSEFLLEKYKSEFNKKAKYEFIEYKDIWKCTCGNINHNYEETCFECLSENGTIKSFDFTEYNKTAIYEKALSYKFESNYEEAINLFESIVDYEDSAEQIDFCKNQIKSIETKNNVKKRTFKLGIVFVSIALVIVLVLTTVVIPNVKKASAYSNGIECIANKDYENAYKYFSTIRGYKDVDEQISKSNELKSAMIKYNQTKYVLGGEVIFGKYAWIPLAFYDNYVLLITKDCVETIQFDTSYRPKTWEGSELHDWAHSEFINTFSEEEKAKISSVDEIHDNHPFDAGYGYIPTNSNTGEKIFLLNCTDIDKYLPYEYSRSCNNWWWLSNNSVRDYRMQMRVMEDGSEDFDGVSQNRFGGFRPCIWLDLTK